MATEANRNQDFDWLINPSLNTRRYSSTMLDADGKPINLLNELSPYDPLHGFIQEGVPYHTWDPGSPGFQFGDVSLATLRDLGVPAKGDIRGRYYDLRNEVYNRPVVKRNIEKRNEDIANFFQEGQDILSLEKPYFGDKWGDNPASTAEFLVKALPKAGFEIFDVLGLTGNRMLNAPIEGITGTDIDDIDLVGNISLGDVATFGTEGLAGAGLLNNILKNTGRVKKLSKVDDVGSSTDDLAYMTDNLAIQGPSGIYGRRLHFPQLHDDYLNLVRSQGNVKFKPKWYSYLNPYSPHHAYGQYRLKSDNLMPWQWPKGVFKGTKDIYREGKPWEISLRTIRHGLKPYWAYEGYSTGKNIYDYWQHMRDLSSMEYDDTTDSYKPKTIEDSRVYDLTPNRYHKDGRLKSPYEAYNDTVEFRKGKDITFDQLRSGEIVVPGYDSQGNWIE